MKRRNSTPFRRRFSLAVSPLPCSTRLSKISRSAPAEKCRRPQYRNIAALLARDQGILGHRIPPLLGATMRRNLWIAGSLHHDLQNASHDDGIFVY